MMSTLEAVENCAAVGKNFIVTHEPTFYVHEDRTDDIANDPTLRYKLDFCKTHNITIFRFHDHWHSHRPDGIAQGMVHQLGWQKNVVDPADPKKLAFDGLTLAALAKQISEKLHARTIRVLGDPNLPVHRVRANWGYLSREGGIRLFSQPDLDVLICGEAREWEAVEYAQDTIRAGAKKGLIVIGHVLSEQGGMIDCAEWLRTFIHEVPIQFIATPEPFWNALNPPKV
ncbi:MAG TPA: Nif3-like dinuclear metal center hexameric protein [Acidobacteriaceae bacterium]|jgi:putative NIF3 family GTP cyclohydrolase 1 type 2